MSFKLDALLKEGKTTDAIRQLSKELYSGGRIGYTRKMLLDELAHRIDKYEGRDNPKKPIEHYNWCDLSEEQKQEESQWFCGKCSRGLGEESNYCSECGQKIDWS